ncbi:MAG: DapH/DapD/GlmU-related protein, partial [Pseudomonadota bacterium]
KRTAAVTVGDACHIGALCVIAKGVTVGDHCLVGAGSVLTESAPAYSIVRGNPARVIGRVHLEEDLRLEFFNP